MQYYFAPMEGITGYQFRQAHRRYFSGVDKYFMPFLSPTRDRLFTRRELRELAPEHNEGLRAVPQLLTRSAGDFIWCAGELGRMGYGEVNLNLGCPSGTVVAKGKGAGFLARPDLLDAFFQEVFSAGLPVKISVKTRLGLEREEEFEPLLEMFSRYPICELTIHPRVRRDFYKYPVRRGAFARALPRCPMAVCYNGDLFTPGQCRALEGEFPAAGALMLGRGLVADPALAAKAAGGRGADEDSLGGFVEEIYAAYCRDFGSPHSAMMRMKELWFYLINLFEDGEYYGKKIKKAASPRIYEGLTADLFRDLALREDLAEDVLLS